MHEDLARARVAGAAGLVQPVVDVDAAHVVRELADPFELLDRGRPQIRGDVHVLAEDDDVHALLIEFGARFPPE